RVVRRMLEKSPAARYDDLQAVELALAAVQHNDATMLPAVAPAARLVVAGFRNITADAEDDWLGTGLAETITADLGALEGIEVVPGCRVRERLRVLARQTGGPEDGLALRAGRELAARWVLTGSFQRAGDA